MSERVKAPRHRHSDLDAVGAQAGSDDVRVVVGADLDNLPSLGRQFIDLAVAAQEREGLGSAVHSAR